MNTPIISIVSKKNSGKTSLIEKIIPELIKRGYSIGTIKHDIHGFDIDHPGKDTWRHKQAGAKTVVISSPWKISLIQDVAEEVGIDEIVERYFGNVDLVLTEGYKQIGKPQIEVFRSNVHSSPLHVKEDPKSLVAVVSDVPVDLGVPCIDINDVQELANFIEKRFIQHQR